MLGLPEVCLRGLGCQPLGQIASDGGESFICCGLNTEFSDDDDPDFGDKIFCRCCHTKENDHHELANVIDLTDMVSVFSQALSVYWRAIERSATEEQ